MKALTQHMKTTLLGLYTAVLKYDDGIPMQPHDVTDIHHKILRGLDSRELIILEVSYSPTGIIWTVALTPKGLREAKKLKKQKPRHNDTEINVDEKKPRSLRTINWQVNVNQETGKQIYEDAKAMKADKKQSFTRTMNQLIALHKELEIGQVGMLQKLYPEAYATMLLIARNEIEMEREGELRDLIAEFKRHIHSTPLSAIKAANFDFSADDETVVMDVIKDENAGKIASENFLRSISAFNPITTNPAPVNNAPRVLSVPTFEVPSYEDDIEDLFA